MSASGSLLLAIDTGRLDPADKPRGVGALGGGGNNAITSIQFELTHNEFSTLLA